MSLDEFRKANEVGVESDDSLEPSQSFTWQPPPRNLIKVNWDAAVSKKNGCVRVGIIARDSMGKVCAARSLTVGQILVPVATEAMVGVHAMLLGKDLNRSGVIIEGDAQQIVSAVNSLNSCMSSYGHFIEDIQEGIRSTGNMSVIFSLHSPTVATIINPCFKTLCGVLLLPLNSITNLSTRISPNTILPYTLVSNYSS
jgi:hypothetical protein